jgi:hypothetical protein
MNLYENVKKKITEFRIVAQQEISCWNKYSCSIVQESNGAWGAFVFGHPSDGILIQIG